MGSSGNSDYCNISMRMPLGEVCYLAQNYHMYSEVISPGHLAIVANSHDKVIVLLGLTGEQCIWVSMWRLNNVCRTLILLTTMLGGFMCGVCVCVCTI